MYMPFYIFTSMIATLVQRVNKFSNTPFLQKIIFLTYIGDPLMLTLLSVSSAFKGIVSLTSYINVIKALGKCVVFHLHHD